jgi:hypothetical protein
MTRGRIAFASSLLAIAAGVALVAFMVPYLVRHDDNDAVIPVFIPLVLATIAFAGLSAKCASGSLLGDRVATIVLTLLFMFTIVSALSIGILVLPMTALVAIAVVLTPAAPR